MFQGNAYSVAMVTSLVSWPKVMAAGWNSKQKRVYRPPWELTGYQVVPQTTEEKPYKRARSSSSPIPVEEAMVPLAQHQTLERERLLERIQALEEQGRLKDTINGLLLEQIRSLSPKSNPTARSVSAPASPRQSFYFSAGGKASLEVLEVHVLLASSSTEPPSTTTTTPGNPRYSPDEARLEGFGA